MAEVSHLSMLPAEVVVSLDARTRATVWEHRHRPASGNEPPNSTPTVVGDRVYTLGVSGLLCALERAAPSIAERRVVKSAA
jgi:hypothetical protein